MSARSFVLSLLTPLLLTAAASAAEVRGIIAKVDPDRSVVVLEGRGLRARNLTFTFAVDRDTRILFGHEPGKLTDLAVGKRATVIFEPVGDRPTALLIQAQGTPASAPAAPSAAPALAGDAITGTLQRVALTEREIVVVGPGPKGPETETTIAVPDSAKVTRGDQAIRFDDLKEGEPVAVTAEKRDGRLSATAVYAGGGKPPAPAATASKQDRMIKIMGIVGQVLRGLDQMRNK